MSSTPAAFAADCKRTAADLRRLPADLRRALAAEVKPRVAVPLATRIAGNARGSYGSALSGAVKARAQADPQIVIGGSRRVVSGGANPRQLVYGTEFGGGGRVSVVAGTPRHRGYRRRSTRQFVPARPFVFTTVGSSIEWVLEEFAGIVDEVLHG